MSGFDHLGEIPPEEFARMMDIKDIEKREAAIKNWRPKQTDTSFGKEDVNTVTQQVSDTKSGDIDAFLKELEAKGVPVTYIDTENKVSEPETKEQPVIKPLPINTVANADAPRNPYSYNKLNKLKEMMDKNETDEDDKHLDEAMLDAWDEGLV